jgi:hypothetical protein
VRRRRRRWGFDDASDCCARSSGWCCRTGRCGGRCRATLCGARSRPPSTSRELNLRNNTLGGSTSAVLRGHDGAEPRPEQAHRERLQQCDVKSSNTLLHAGMEPRLGLARLVTTDPVSSARSSHACRIRTRAAAANMIGRTRPLPSIHSTVDGKTLPTRAHFHVGPRCWSSCWGGREKETGYA